MAVQMTKSQLIEKIAAENEVVKKDVKGVLETLATIGYKELKKNGVFLVPGFAKFVVIKKPATKARKGTNPSTANQWCSRPNLLARSSEHARSRQQKTRYECQKAPSGAFFIDARNPVETRSNEASRCLSLALFGPGHRRRPCPFIGCKADIAIARADVRFRPRPS
jgi:nucleoid DNA-binding protein